MKFLTFNQKYLAAVFAFVSFISIRVAKNVRTQMTFRCEILILYKRISIEIDNAGHYITMINFEFTFLQMSQLKERMLVWMDNSWAFNWHRWVNFYNKIIKSQVINYITMLSTEYKNSLPRNKFCIDIISLQCESFHEISSH